MSWTPEKVEKLKELWGKGNTASEIAQILGGVTRNAVIGKANRLGLSKKLSTEEIIVKKEISASSLVPDMSGCKWPIGHPGDSDFYFCGKPTIPGKPYCGEHCVIAYRRKDSHQKVKKFFKLNADS